MATPLEEQLARIRTEIARQDAAWERAKLALHALDAAQICVPPDRLEQIDDACRPHLPSAESRHAIRA
jgi:hypothetical protein